MSYFKDVQIALDARLDALAGSTPIAWESVSYIPANGTAFLRPTVLMSPANLMDLNTLQLNEGIYQIDLFYPADDGMGDMLDKIDAIHDHFKGSSTLTSNSVNVYIKEIGRTGPARVEDGWLMSSIEVHFKVYES